MNALLVGLALVATATPALARDSTVLVCSGVAQPTDDSERAGISIDYVDRRASDGKSRTYWLAEIFLDKVVEATWTGDDEGVATKIVLRAGKLVRFRGTYAIARNGRHSSMRLVGQLLHQNDDQMHPIDVTLPCVDISI